MSLQAQTLNSPANGSTVTTSIVTFSWSAAPAAGERYEVRVFHTVTGALELNISFGPGINNEHYTFRSGTYRADIRLCKPQCVAGASTNFTVTNRTASPGTAANVNCTTVNDNNQNRVDCTWNAVALADFYLARLVQAGTGPGGGALTVAGNQIGSTSVSLVAPNGPLSFVVQACTGDGCGGQSSPVVVNSNFGSPLLPRISEPMAGSVVEAGSNAPVALFAWNRIAGDTGAGEVVYRLYISDFSRNAPALDVLTTSNFQSAFLNPSNRYDALVIAYPNFLPFGPTSPITAPVQGPPVPLIARGRVPSNPTVSQPWFSVGFVNFPTPTGQTMRASWTPLPDAQGQTGNRLYQYRVIGVSFDSGIRATGVTLENSVDVPAYVPGGFPAGNVLIGYVFEVRACQQFATCTAGSETGWGPWSGSPGSEGFRSEFGINKTSRLGVP